MPRPRFTLRAALVVTAIVAAVAAKYSFVFRRVQAMDAGRHTFVVSLPLPGPNSPDPTKVGWLRDLLGDRMIHSIYVAPGENKTTETARLRELFPEAEIDPPPPEYTF
ncbi:hypothetical protein [Lacipirellula sp.]|uniref:hypothetical protein n=1 Tax=Lacipirellula sp. TaxID=2691419 RepID=UPI003D13D759